MRQIGNGVIESIEGIYGVISKTDAFIGQISFGTNIYPRGAHPEKRVSIREIDRRPEKGRQIKINLQA